MRELFINLDLSIFDTLELFFYMMPMFLLMVLPISCMLGVFLTFLRMSTDRELIALKAGGVSLFQLLSSPLLFSVVCMLVAFFVSLHGISWGMDQFRSTLLQFANSKAQIVVQPGIFNQDLLGKTLFARRIDPATGTLYQVIFEDKVEDQQKTIIFIAPEGEIYTDAQKGEMHFSLRNGKIYQIQGSKMNIMNFKTYTVQLDLSKLLSGVEIGGIRPKEMSWLNLIRMNREKNAPSARFQYKVGVEIQKRLVLPTACLILGIFALPVACFFQGVHRQIGIVVALVMFLCYYSIFSLGISLGESGKVSPIASMWFGNLLFSVLTLVSLIFVGKEKVPDLSRWLLSRQKKHAKNKLLM